MQINWSAVNCRAVHSAEKYHRVVVKVGDRHIPTISASFNNFSVGCDQLLIKNQPTRKEEMF